MGERIFVMQLPYLANRYEAWELQLQRTEYQKKMLELWNETAKQTKNGNPMDAFICPIAPFAAVSHNNYDHVSYTSWVSLTQNSSFSNCKADVD